MHVFVRDWLSANNVLLRSRDGHVLIDSGYATHAPFTLALLRSEHGLRGEPLAQLVNTHGHSDHVGGNAAVQRAYGCTIAFPAGEAPLIDAWDEEGLWFAYADQYAERFTVDERLEAGGTRVWGGLEWRMLAAPGHDMGALVFFNPEHRILISGDALWQNGYGLIVPPALDPRALPATRATLDMIAGLDARVVIPGHGEVFTDVAAALERAYQRTAAFEADETRVARHALKVLLVFTLLHRRRLALSELAGYLDRVGFFRDVNAACLRIPASELAQALTADLTRAGAVRIEDGCLVPA
ncbi:MAG: MBL fold metallo-hydrolase [Burkholderiales bacterium]|nr:MBL fold metallo-hydrolase [Burkholderiales bacterium]